MEVIGKRCKEIGWEHRRGSHRFHGLRRINSFANYWSSF